MKLNLGCGHNKHDGYVNVDLFKESMPDVVHDLETFPWPWGDNSVDEAMFNHSLEHLGGDSRVFLKIIQELYRVCKPGALVVINVPHPRHDNFIGDPTHVRVITPNLLKLFDKQLNDEWKRLKAANSPFAHYLGVDFEITSVITNLDEPYGTLFTENKISAEEINVLLRERNNIAKEYRITLNVRK